MLGNIEDTATIDVSSKKMNRKKLMINLIITISLIVLSIESTFATGQIPDLLIIKNDTGYIFTNPLELYFSKIGNRDIPGFSGCASSACWRGYVAIWTIENDSLFLTRIISCHKGENFCQDSKDGDLSAMFGERFKNNRVFADWYSGEIIKPSGRLIRYIHMGYASTYEFENRYKIDNGIISNIQKFTNYHNDTDRIDRIDYFDTRLYMYDYIKENLDWSIFPPDSTRYEDFQVTIDKNGRIGKIENVDWIWKAYKRAIKDALKDIGKFDIISIQGKKVEEIYTFEFEFDFINKTVKEFHIDSELEWREKRKNK